jgi:hypothetical protein
MATSEFNGPIPLQANADNAAILRWARAVYQWSRGVHQGRTNNVGEVTLTQSAATTVVTDARVGINSAILFDPTTANAKADYVNAGFYVSTRRNGTFTITHPNNANADKTFKYVMVG